MGALLLVPDTPVCSRNGSFVKVLRGFFYEPIDRVAGSLCLICLAGVAGGLIGTGLECVDLCYNQCRVYSRCTAC